MKILQKFLPHIVALVLFIVAALIYCYPVLQRKTVYQSDIVQYTGMAKEQNDFRAENEQEPYWTNAAFGGMPTYQLGANYPHNYVKKLDTVIRFLPRPADYIFLYFLGFYTLIVALGIDYRKGIIGALAFGFSTYLIVILNVGHNAKAHAIAYMPLVLAGLIWIFRGKRTLGFVVSTLAIALEINANHFQMTYYLLFLLLAVGIYYVYEYAKRKEYKPLFLNFGIFVGAGIFALGANAGGLLATAEYTDWSIRGKSELSFKADGSKKTSDASMEYEYITEYSYGIAESLNLIVPRLFGGSNNESLDENSAVVDQLQKTQIAENQYIPKEQAIEYAKEGMPTYWGDQPIVAAPAYIGVTVFFLALLALFYDQRKIKYAFLAASLLTLFLSWGKNLDFLTRFFVEYVPLYDKFRAVSSIQVVLELCMPLLAVMGLQTFWKLDAKQQQKALIKTGSTVLGVLILIFTGKYFAEFSTVKDDELVKQLGAEIVAALRKDREAMYTTDTLKAIAFTIAISGILWLFLKQKLKSATTLTLIGLLILIDLISVDKRYLNADNFVPGIKMREPFDRTVTDSEILADSTIFRVYDIQGRLNARVSYFHKSVGGYSAVRPRRYDQLFEFGVERDIQKWASQINPETGLLGIDYPVLSALNVKYVLIPTEQGEVAVGNPFAYGNAWFVKSVVAAKSADEEFKATVNSNLRETAILASADAKELAGKSFAADSLAQIRLTSAKAYTPNKISYRSENTNDGFAVFSESYYKDGWIAKIDGKEAPIYRVNYVLRGLFIPKGSHQITFEFKPQVVQTGGMISLISTIVLLLILVVVGFKYVKASKK